MAKGLKTGGRVAGTPNKATAEVKELALVFGPAAIQRAAELAGLVDGKKAAESEAAQMSALNTILDRAYGKPKQSLDVDAQVNATVTEIRRKIVDPAHRDS